ncbi:MAG TPA: hypothetical protein VFX96_13505, partial [Pyrinomonadaceae bacterium]|nr:hypothetical protein [Pyrinomonadaceae bacterium]
MTTSPQALSAKYEHPLTPFYQGFSCPDEKFDEPFFEAVATNFAREAVRLFLKNHAAELEREGRGLVSLLEDWLAGEPTFDTIWDPAFGGALSALAGKEAEPTGAAAGLALRLCAQGRAADCEVRLGRPSRLMWHQWLLPCADAVKVESDGRRARISLRDAGTLREVEFTRTEEGFWRSVGAQELPRVGTSRARITLLPKDAAR